MGRIGVKVWVYLGDVLPEPKEVEPEVDAEEMRLIEVTVGGQEETEDVATEENQVPEST